ncbi:MAG TPA: response regulator [Thermoanaerobaculia bacterium]|nr:response regulator [Thermoanaerobaculia bacterium]
MSLERRALVVDDDAGIRILVKHILSRNNFTVDLARDGIEAIEKLVVNDYDVIVLDIMMPRIDGRGVVEYLERFQPENIARVIVMTAFGSSAFNRVSPPVGRILEKPFDIDHLLREVTECCWMTGSSA